MNTHALYRAAMAADDAFESAIHAEGFKSRWDWNGNQGRQGSQRLLKAYAAKIAADSAMLAGFEARRNERIGQ